MGFSTVTHPVRAAHLEVSTDPDLQIDGLEPPPEHSLQSVRRERHCSKAWNRGSLPVGGFRWEDVGVSSSSWGYPKTKHMGINHE